MSSLQITVRDTSGRGGLRPVTGGVPLAQGAAPAGAEFALTTAGGQPVPLQSRVLARWKDGSARWVLLDFMADVPAAGSAAFALSPGRVGSPAPACTGVRLAAGPGGGILAVGDGLRVGLELILDDGQVCTAVATSTGVECEGPLRRTLTWRGDLRTAAGQRAFQFRLRASAFAGTGRVRLEPLVLVDADTGILQRDRKSVV